LTEYQQNATRIGHAKLDFRLQQETGGLWWGVNIISHV
jgi:hypothetical protein